MTICFEGFVLKVYPAVLPKIEKETGDRLVYACVWWREKGLFCNLNVFGKIIVLLQHCFFDKMSLFCT